MNAIRKWKKIRKRNLVSKTSDQVWHFSNTCLLASQRRSFSSTGEVKQLTVRCLSEKHLNTQCIISVSAAQKPSSEFWIDFDSSCWYLPFLTKLINLSRWETLSCWKKSCEIFLPVTWYAAKPAKKLKIIQSLKSGVSNLVAPNEIQRCETIMRILLSKINDHLTGDDLTETA